MANPLYQQLMGNMMNGGVSQGGTPSFSGTGFQNPVMKMRHIMQAMTNPAAFVKNAFPDIPDEIQNNPGQILNWLQRTRGVSDQHIHQAQQMAEQIQGQGTVR